MIKLLKVKEFHMKSRPLKRCQFTINASLDIYNWLEQRIMYTTNGSDLKISK